jgi:hypothetical protein
VILIVSRSTGIAVLESGERKSGNAAFTVWDIITDDEMRSE